MISPFSRLRFVLVEPYHPGNIGSVARAMKTMGFTRLIVVNPHEVNFANHEEALAFASNAHDVLAAAQTVNKIEDALEGSNFAAALSSRPRAYTPPVLTARALAENHAVDPKLEMALILGSERYGLPNEVIEKCNALISIPANPDYPSLNLAQSVQVLAYECRQAILGDKLNETEVGRGGERAKVIAIDGMINHLEEALTAIGYLDTHSPKKLFPRLRRLFSRAELEEEEVNILRGIARQMIWEAEKTKAD